MDSIQHGFCNGKSVILVYVYFIESAINSINARGPHVWEFEMDLSKAFDSATLLKNLLTLFG